MKELLIKRCRDNMMWYASKIGQTVPLLREGNCFYWSRQDEGYSNIVHKDDAEVVENDQEKAD